MCDYPFFIPQVVLFANSSLFWFKVTNEHREFRNYLLIDSYCKISDENHNAQIALLYAGCLYIKEKYNCCLEIPEFYYKGIQRLFEETRLNLPIDLRETLIFERLFLLLFNAAIFGYTI